MHLDGFVIERDIPAPASEVLAAIVRGGEWRESAIPDELKKDRVIGIDARVNGSKFRWFYARSSYRMDGYFVLELWGRVEESSNGNSRIVARCGYNRGLTGLMVAAGVIAVLAFFGGGSGALVLAGIGVASAIPTFAWNSRAASGRDKEANYLVDRFEQVLHRFTTNGNVRAPAI